MPNFKANKRTFLMKMEKGTSGLYKKKGYGKSSVFMKTEGKETSLEKKYKNNPDYPKGDAYLAYWERARDGMVKQIEAGNRGDAKGPMSYEEYIKTTKNIDQH